MDKIDELINRRENQLLLHACLYFDGGKVIETFSYSI